MATMPVVFDVRRVGRWFRVIALAEAASWVGLLIGMYFKYLGAPRTEVGVQIFGPVHGAIFIAFVAAALLAGITFNWGLRAWLLALLGSVVPLGSVIFLIWADRNGLMGAASAETAEVTGAQQPGDR
ncbi:MAG: DUF3817 domain-containing protein [Actinomycetia bacterium]|nr:DUF3817 domain-containing protein [Actinomycetes bacterium]MCH9708898.1 DUF3817 domain-containing protein [Actinomycetes bacterium]MCH9769015.1 DUF3817 domain-containing protein [Actinomycetes bacterium]